MAQRSCYINEARRSCPIKAPGGQSLPKSADQQVGVLHQSAISLAHMTLKNVASNNRAVETQPKERRPQRTTRPSCDCCSASRDRQTTDKGFPRVFPGGVSCLALVCLPRNKSFFLCRSVGSPSRIKHLLNAKDRRGFNDCRGLTRPLCLCLRLSFPLDVKFMRRLAATGCARVVLCKLLEDMFCPDRQRRWDRKSFGVIVLHNVILAQSEFGEKERLLPIM